MPVIELGCVLRGGHLDLVFSIFCLIYIVRCDG